LFNLPHIFVVFNPGSSGNFIAGIINKLVSSNLDPVAISSTGSSHTVLNNKSAGTDFLSFGTMIEEHESFQTEEDRETFYLENIKKSYSNVSVPMVTWTHDFTNIPLIRKHFKNSRILVITNTTDRERLSSVFLNILKTLLDKNAAIPIPDRHWQTSLEKWLIVCRMELSKFYKQEQVDKILKDKFNKEYKDVLTFASIRALTRYYGMFGLIEHITYPEKQVFDYVLYPKKVINPPYDLGNRLDSYIDDQCITLPFNYLLNNDCDLLIKKLSALLGKTLKIEEQTYIKETFAKYFAAQNQQIMSDPVQYYRNLKDTSLTTTI
jgi:hypothetical protein